MKSCRYDEDGYITGNHTDSANSQDVSDSKSSLGSNTILSSVPSSRLSRDHIADYGISSAEHDSSSRSYDIKSSKESNYVQQSFSSSLVSPLSGSVGTSSSSLSLHPSSVDSSLLLRSRVQTEELLSNLSVIEAEDLRSGGNASTNTEHRSDRLNLESSTRTAPISKVSGNHKSLSTPAQLTNPPHSVTPPTSISEERSPSPALQTNRIETQSVSLPQPASELAPPSWPKSRINFSPLHTPGTSQKIPARSIVSIESSQSSTSSASSYASSHSPPCHTPDSFANIGRNLMFPHPLSAAKSDVASSTRSNSVTSHPPNEHGREKDKWWTQFRSGDDWNSFRKDANDYLNIMILAETMELEGDESSAFSGDGNESPCEQVEVVATEVVEKAAQRNGKRGNTEMTNWLQGLQDAAAGTSETSGKTPPERCKSRSKPDLKHQFKSSSDINPQSLLKKLSSIQQKMKQLPPIPPSIHNDNFLDEVPDVTVVSSSSTSTSNNSDDNNCTPATGSTNKKTKRLLGPLSPLSGHSSLSSSSTFNANSHPHKICIPLHLICPLCKDVVLGATLIDCQHCGGSIANGGSVAYCRKCLEERTGDEGTCEDNGKSTVSCPSCSNNQNIPSSSSPVSRLCRPIPCHALDVAIANILAAPLASPSGPIPFSSASYSSPSPTLDRDDDLSSLTSQQQLSLQYRSRLAAWRTEILNRRKALQSEHAQYQEKILAKVIDTEEEIFWKNKDIHKCISEIDEDESASAEVDTNQFDKTSEGDVMKVGLEADELVLRKREGVSNTRYCSLSLPTAFMTAATAGAGIFFAMQAKRK